MFPSQLSDGKGHGVRALQLKHAAPGSLIQTEWEREYENQCRSASRYNSTHLYIHTPVRPYLTTQFIFKNRENFSPLSWPWEWLQKELSNLPSKLQVKDDSRNFWNMTDIGRQREREPMKQTNLVQKGRFKLGEQLFFFFLMATSLSLL